MHTLQITEHMDDAFCAVLRIRDPRFMYFLPKNMIQGVHFGSLIVDLDLSIPDPGSRAQKSTGSRIQIHNDAFWELTTPDQWNMYINELHILSDSHISAILSSVIRRHTRFRSLVQWAGSANSDHFGTSCKLGPWKPRTFCTWGSLKNHLPPHPTP